MTWAGVVFGGRVGTWMGRKVEIAGGLILIGIGVRILIEHL
ncbi:MAG: manganese efflux pump MntP [Syntrophaceae bacterium PtaU1.Bin231]|nr:MAG: manganese efflux pump MntP [Syntrophaceae bacterium PtaU1.Bin231]